MRLRYKRRGQLFPRDVTMTRLTVFLSLGTVRQYAPATAAGWGLNYPQPGRTTCVGSEGRTDAQGPRGARDDGGTRARGPTDAAVGLGLFPNHGRLLGRAAGLLRRNDAVFGGR